MVCTFGGPPDHSWWHNMYHIYEGSTFGHLRVAIAFLCCRRETEALLVADVGVLCLERLVE
jgi:hypothetical protein